MVPSLAVLTSHYHRQVRSRYQQLFGKVCVLVPWDMHM